MTTAKSVSNIADMKVGDTGTYTLAVSEATARNTRAGKPYLAVDLFDGKEHIKGNYWDWSSGNMPSVNSVVDVKATVDSWQGSKQLKITGMHLNQSLDITAFVPVSGHDIDAMYVAAYAEATNVKNDFLRTVVLGVLEALRHKWGLIPGAKAVHHAYLGGTLVHSLSVARIARSIADNYTEANSDLCFVGGLLHDIGKLYTYEFNGVNIELTNEGALFDHTYIGARFISNFCEEFTSSTSDSEANALMLLQHIILSHHGALEHGAVVLPQFIEAHIVHAADKIDACIEQIARAPKANDMWTERIYTLGNRSHLTTTFVDSVMRDG